MGEAYFYHLTRQPLEAALPKLLGLALKQGWRISVRGPTAERVSWLDERLWLEEGFLPHGQAGSGFDADQPILLTSNTDMANAPDCLVCFDGAEVAPDEVLSMTRTMVVFNGHDGEALETARGQWKTLTGAGVPAKYWSQEAGPWEMKAEHKADG